MTTPTPSGTLGTGPLGPELQLTRQFEASIAEVWASITECERLERWIGRWEGDPATGKLLFYMTSEGADVEGEEYTISACDPPRSFAVDTRVGAQQWHLRVHLSETKGVTTLLFSQLLSGDDMSTVGPGWEYYLDRLAVAMAGRDAGTVLWDDYYPALSEYYAELTGTRA